MATHNLHVAASIPPDVAPADIIAALHDHNTSLTLQALTTEHKQLPETDPQTRKDTWWYPVDLHPITTYEVTECITWFPGIGEWGKRYITFPSCFQNTPHGIKTRADAAGGVLLRAEFRVIKGGSVEGEVEGEGEGIGYAEWVLVEDVEVNCAWWMMPFVRSKMEEAHRDICRKVVEQVVMKKRQESVRNLEEARVKSSERRRETLSEALREGQREKDRRQNDSTYKIEMPKDEGDGADEVHATGQEPHGSGTSEARAEVGPLPEKISYA